jgi:hypothetical protein
MIYKQLFRPVYLENTYMLLVVFGRTQENILQVNYLKLSKIVYINNLKLISSYFNYIYILSIDIVYPNT